MKKLLPLLFLIFFISFGFSQKKVNINNLVQYGDKMFKQNDDKPYTGRVFDLNRLNGNKILEGNYKNGVKHGKWTTWYENGQKEYEKYYSYGKEDKLWIMWDRNNGKKYKGEYIGDLREMSDNQISLLNGVFIFYEGSKKIIHSKMINGEPDGLVTLWYKEEGKIEMIYKNGKIISSKEWNEDGSVKE